MHCKHLKYRMGKLMLYIVMSIALLLYGCKERTKDFDAEATAREYCSCLNDQRGKYDIFDARIICDSKLSLKNRFFRLYQGDVMFGNRLSKLPKATVDSVLEFNNLFNDYIFENCKEAVVDDVNFDLKFPNRN